MKRIFTAISKTAMKNDEFAYRLVAGTIIVNIFVYIIVGYSIYNSRLHYDKLAEISTQNMAKSLEANISGIFDKIDIGLSAVVFEAERQLATHGIEKDELNAYIQKQLSQLPEIYTMLATDSKGNLRYGIDIPIGKLVNTSDREYFHRLRDNHNEGLVLSKLMRGRISGKWNLSLVKRINRPDGTFGGVVIGGFDVSYFDKLFSQLDIGKHGAIGIRDMEFNLIALQPKGKEPGSQIGSNVISKKTREMIKANPVTATYKTVFARDNKERMVTFRKASRYPFYVFATIAPSDYMAPWRKEVTTSIALTVFFTLVTSISARVIFKSRLTTVLHAEAKRHSEEMERQNKELNCALSRVKRLEGTIPICSYCKKIRNQQQSWEQIEKYFTEHSDAIFTHGICPECAKEQMQILHDMKSKNI